MLKKRFFYVIILFLFLSFNIWSLKADNTSAVNLWCSSWNTKCIQAENLINSMRAKWGGWSFNKKLLDPQTMVYWNSYRIKDIKNERDLLIAKFQIEVLGLYPLSISWIK